MRRGSKYERERQVAIRAVRDAARLCEAVRRDLDRRDRQTKEDRSPVTVADYGAQALVSLALAAAFPDDPVIGEEDVRQLLEGPERIRRQVVEHTARLQDGLGEAEVLEAIDRCRGAGGPHGRHWILDPIDGTKGFLRNDQYAIALALLDEGEVVLGLLGCPLLPRSFADAASPRGVLVLSERDAGAVELALEGDGDEKRLQVDPTRDPRRATFCESVEAAHSDHHRHAAIAARLGVTSSPLRIDSQCKYATVARGDASIYLRLPTSASYEEKIWDHAAGFIAVREAGGRVTDAFGRELDFSCGRTLRRNRGIVATNGSLHRPVQEAVLATQ